MIRLTQELDDFEATLEAVPYQQGFSGTGDDWGSRRRMPAQVMEEIQVDPITIGSS